MSGVQVGDPLDVLPPTSRFRIVRRLGTGGMGVVFEAEDVLHGTRVALKMIRRLSPEALLRFKTEFRALQDLQHPNLVRLDELICDHNHWLFTMELVEGVDFLTHVGAGDAGRELALSHTLEESADGIDRPPAASLGGATASPIPAPARRFDEVLLRAALAQLVQGIAALHAAGKVHRDIKPSNILVTAEGRVVLLDFGIVADVRGGADSRAIGTPLYMAPEQIDGRAVGPPSDWYAVGLMLYQALTGHLPFGASALEALELRKRLEPVSPLSLVADLPDDLVRLCMDLLRVEPGERPDDLEMLRRLSLPGTDVWPRERFVGRRRELDELDACFAAVRAGSARTLLIQGESGTGKTALMTRFLERLDPSVVVLAGRCYERESVPYKAVDEAVDALSWYLKRLPPAQAEAVLPRHGAALAQLFPVLQRAPLVVDAMPEGSEAALEPYELRLHAFAALRELVARIARQQPLVLAIDDLQWADADSMALLEDLLAPPLPPGLFVLATVRPPSSAVPDATAAPKLPGAHALRLTGLDLEEARELADVLLARTPTAADERARIAAVIASESHGHPLFIDELVRRNLALGGERETPRLEDALSARIQGLSPEERSVLELLAIAAAPLAQDVAAAATRIGFDELARRAASLRAVNLVRSAATTAGPALEPYHDRVRRSAIAGLAPTARRELHGKLAEALEQRRADAELLALHFHEAGEPRRAAAHAAVAATRAAAALAFERAAQLFRTAAAHEPPGTPEGQRLRIGLAEALTNAGLCADAARAFEDAAAAADPATAAQLEQRAAEQHLRAGHIDAGIAATSRVLALHGLALPRTPRRALLLLALRRALLRLRGLRYRERPAGEVPAKQLSRIDVCFSVSANLGVVDPVRGGDFQTRSLLWALRAGEPARIARALAGEAGYAATRGARGRARADHLLDLAGQLARRIDDPHVLGLVHCFTGFTGYLTGDWALAREHCERARAIWRGRCVGVSWELDANDLVHLSAMTYQGEIAELARRVAPLLRDAEARGDLYAVTSLRAVFVPVVHLAADQPHEARREGAQAIRAWSKADFHIVHFNFEIVAQGYISLYLGEAESAYERISTIWSSAQTSLLRFVQHMRIVAVQMRALCALAAAARGRARTDWLRAARRDVRRLRREHAPWARGWIDLLTAGIAYQRGDRDTAATLLRDATTHCETAGLHLHAAVARRRLGELLQGDEGRQLTSAADVWMEGQGIRAPRRWTAVLAPGFSDE